MNRQSYDEGRWFDTEAAERWDPRGRGASFHYSDDNDNIVEATVLWRTRKGQFIVQSVDHGCWSISDTRAVRIMIDHDLDVPHDLQDEVGELEG